MAMAYKTRNHKSFYWINKEIKIKKMELSKKNIKSWILQYSNRETPNRT